MLFLLAKPIPNLMCGDPETGGALLHVTIGAWHGSVGTKGGTKEALMTQLRPRSGLCTCILAAPNPAAAFGWLVVGAFWWVQLLSKHILPLLSVWEQKRLGIW